MLHNFYKKNILNHMTRAFNIAATGAITQSHAVEIISNNIANTDTAAFKAQIAITKDLQYQNATVDADYNQTVPTNLQYGSGAVMAATVSNQKQGDFIQTDNSLDITIMGRGYFVVNMPDGTQSYTRDGHFQIDPDTNQIVTIQGNVLSPGVTIPTDAQKIIVGNDGTVLVQLPGNPDLQTQGQFDVAMFINENGLERIGDNLLSQTTASGDPIVGHAGDDNFGAIKQGAIEGSNVQPIIEMTNLVQAQRAYEMNVQVIRKADEMLSEATNV